MSQFTFTAEEDALVVTALQFLAEVQGASHGGATDEVKALLAKIAEQQTPNVPVEQVVVEEVAEVEEKVEAEQSEEQEAQAE